MDNKKLLEELKRFNGIIWYDVSGKRTLNETPEDSFDWAKNTPDEIISKLHTTLDEFSVDSHHKDSLTVSDFYTVTDFVGYILEILPKDFADEVKRKYLKIVTDYFWSNNPNPDTEHKDVSYDNFDDGGLEQYGVNDGQTEYGEDYLELSRNKPAKIVRVRSDKYEHQTNDNILLENGQTMVFDRDIKWGVVNEDFGFDELFNPDMQYMFPGGINHEKLYGIHDDLYTYYHSHSNNARTNRYTFVQLYQMYVNGEIISQKRYQSRY